MSAAPSALSAVWLALHGDSPSSQSAALFWLAVLVLLAAVIGGLAWNLHRQIHRRPAGPRDSLRLAGEATLALADWWFKCSEQKVGAASEGMDPEIQADVERAARLASRARTMLADGRGVSSLIEANSIAAHAGAIVRDVELRIHRGPAPALPNRCLYCASLDGSSYRRVEIADREGHRLPTTVCAACDAALSAGRSPRIATASVNGLIVPWYADPTAKPWWTEYGGVAWQYWLPFVAGIDAWEWFSSAAPPDEAR